jgi:hypothetical protein
MIDHVWYGGDLVVYGILRNQRELDVDQEEADAELWS